MSRSYNGGTGEITKGQYLEIEKLFNEINRNKHRDIFSFCIDTIIKHL